jgi:hypothetical protein
MCWSGLDDICLPSQKPAVPGPSISSVFGGEPGLPAVASNVAASIAECQRRSANSAPLRHRESLRPRDEYAACDSPDLSKPYRPPRCRAALLRLPALRPTADPPASGMCREQLSQPQPMLCRHVSAGGVNRLVAFRTANHPSRYRDIARAYSVTIQSERT